MQLQEKETIQKTMCGFVSKEREKHEQMNRKMERDLEAKSEKLRQVKELIRNSPCPTWTPFKEKNACEEEDLQHQKDTEQVQMEQQPIASGGVSVCSQWEVSVCSQWGGGGVSVCSQMGG